MNYEILSKPSYSLLKLVLDSGEEVIAETGAMVFMDGVKLKTEMKGGLLGGLKRAIGGESFFVNRFIAEKNNAVLGLAPPYQGDVVAVDVSGTLYAQSGAFLAGSPNLNITSKWGGAKSFFAGEGIILLKIEGEGKAFLSSFGGIEELEVDGEIVIDTGHIVAFEDGLDFTISRSGGLKATILSGEGLVAKFKGKGKVWIQTRSVSDYIGWLSSLIPDRD
ncbi:TIGR00266 family protein [Geoglobus acetivorans]|uniref:TIGR00266 family protein n=1 Tax=Geoglobus acetivorans TaxID=565033 RepID=A0ABZ3H2M9_GEOAI|nr:TIGR00266 family protein [Geoglobus acetivorans]